MERTISAEERIRRAEEIYARRKNLSQDTGSAYARVNVGEKRRPTPVRKMIIQICVCAIIYAGFYVVKSENYMFSGELINRIKSVLEYDISFQNLSNNVINYINQIQNPNAEIPEENKLDNIDNKLEEGLTEGISTESVQTETLGVAEENPEYAVETSSISQEEIDANYIKENVSIIKPLSGTITSRFGSRNPTVSTVPKYHTGIDIAANTGTKIIAAMEGKVVQVSSQGDYGNHVKIQNGEVTTMYAHCSKIYVNEGDKINQGQEIAEVGATRKCNWSAFAF